MITVSTARAIELANQVLVNNPFVAWYNEGATATLGGTAIIAGGERANAVTGSTYDKWRPNVTGTTAALSFDFGTARTIKFASIAAHNAYTFGATVALQSSPNNSVWTTVSSALAVKGAMAFRVTGSARYWRFNFTGLTASNALSVGVAFMGQELVIPTRLYQGFAPVITPTEVQLQSNVSVGGELLGSSVITQGSRYRLTYHLCTQRLFVVPIGWIFKQRSALARDFSSHGVRKNTRRICIIAGVMVT